MLLKIYKYQASALCRFNMRKVSRKLINIRVFIFYMFALSQHQSLKSIKFSPDLTDFERKGGIIFILFQYFEINHC